MLPDANAHPGERGDHLVEDDEVFVHGGNTAPNETDAKEPVPLPATNGMRQFELRHTRGEAFLGRGIDPIARSMLGVTLPQRRLSWEEQSGRNKERQVGAFQAELVLEEEVGARPWEFDRFQAVSLTEDPYYTTVGSETFVHASPAASIEWHEETRGHRLSEEARKHLLRELTSYSQKRHATLAEAVKRIVELQERTESEDDIAAYVLVGGQLNLLRWGEVLALDELIKQGSAFRKSVLLHDIGEILGDEAIR